MKFKFELKSSNFNQKVQILTKRFKFELLGLSSAHESNVTVILLYKYKFAHRYITKNKKCFYSFKVTVPKILVPTRGVWPVKIRWYSSGAWAHWLVFVLRLVSYTSTCSKGIITFHNNVTYGEEQFRVSDLGFVNYRFFVVFLGFFFFGCNKNSRIKWCDLP